MKKTLHFDFPLRYPHEGICLGNGLQGLLVWGGAKLHVTVGHAGFWDRRGGSPLNSATTYSEVRRLLEAGDEIELRGLFAAKVTAGVPPRSQQYGAGRIEVDFGTRYRVTAGTLDLGSAGIELLVSGMDRDFKVTIRQSPLEPVFFVDSELACHVRVCPAWDWIGSELAAWDIPPPEEVELAGNAGFVQRLPDDAGLSMLCRKSGNRFLVASYVDANPDARVAEILEAQTFETIAHESSIWWQRYWSDVPRITLPDNQLQRMLDYSLFKQGGLNPPHALPAGLQGAWMEDTRIPPWSNDYHFNINVQLIYSAALSTNRLEHFKPLWKMIQEWLPRLRETGRTFFGNEKALMLPHAVDDRCNVIGSFWTGTIDHGCTAWVAQLAWKYFLYTQDREFLRKLAWPLLNGAFEGFWSMLEVDDSGRFVLPVSVSPEYKGAAIDAWGRNASFQLAAAHALTQILPQAAAALVEPIDPRWMEVESRLPYYTLEGGDSEHAGIALWDGQNLEESHRHHSHLASIYPFCTIDPSDQQYRRIVANSLRRWVRVGAGGWTGWCVAWASILCQRCGLPDASISWLHWLRLCFTNRSGATLHNADFEGVAIRGNDALNRENWSEAGEPNQVMQMDAAMGCISAITEILVSCRQDGVIYVLPAPPRGWREFQFDGIRAEGGFLIGATIRQELVREVRVHSLFGGCIRLNHRLGDSWEIEGQPASGAFWEAQTKAGHDYILRAT